MKAVRIHPYHEYPTVDDVDEPAITAPHDVIVRVGGAGLCLKTSARSVVKLDRGLEPAAVAALADAGLTAIHAVKKMIPLLHPGATAVVIGAGGLGHIGLQCSGP